VPRGFARLRCMDVPKGMQPRSGTGTDEGSDDYAHINDHEEARKNSEESDNDSDPCFKSGQDLLNEVAKHISTSNGNKMIR